MNLILAFPWESATLAMASSLVVLGAIYWGGSRSGASNKSATGRNESEQAKKKLLRAASRTLGVQPKLVAGADIAEGSEPDETLDREYAFRGRHLLASYTGCSQAALHDVDGLTKALHDAVKASGATLLDSVRHIFPPHGMTAVVLLSESHASIHTYPEHQSCFVDIFTCGTTCQVEAFDAALRVFLKPQSANRRIIDRHDDMLDEEAAQAAA